MGKSTPNPPTPPPFFPVDIPTAMQQALAYDVAGYDFSDADFASRFPGLVQTRTSQLNDAVDQLTGPLDPTVQNSFVTQGLTQGQGAYGSGDPLSALGMTTGSAGRNSATASFADSVLAKQDADRANFSQLLGENPQRAFGLGGPDVAGLTALNTGNLNSFNTQAYQSQLAGIYGQGQTDVATGQNIAALGALLSRVSSTYRGG